MADLLFFCFLIELELQLDTSTSHPKCELQTLNTLFVNDVSRGCTFGSISCHSLSLYFEAEEVVDAIIEEIVEEDCIAGNEILTTQSGLMQADQVEVGMHVRGMSGADATERWCEVLKVVDHGVGSVIDGFTHNHLVLDANLNIKPNYKLEYTDMNKTQSDAHLVNIFTDCEAVTTTAGAVSTRFSTFLYIHTHIFVCLYVCMYSLHNFIELTSNYLFY